MIDDCLYSCYVFSIRLIKFWSVHWRFYHFVKNFELDLCSLCSVNLLIQIFARASNSAFENCLNQCLLLLQCFCAVRFSWWPAFFVIFFLTLASSDVRALYPVIRKTKASTVCQIHNASIFYFSVLVFSNGNTASVVMRGIGWKGFRYIDKYWHVLLRPSS